MAFIVGASLGSLKGMLECAFPKAPKYPNMGVSKASTIRSIVLVLHRCLLSECLDLWGLWHQYHVGGMLEVYDPAATFSSVEAQTAANIVLMYM